MANSGGGGLVTADNRKWPSTELGSQKRNFVPVSYRNVRRTSYFVGSVNDSGVQRNNNNNNKFVSFSILFSLNRNNYFAPKPLTAAAIPPGTRNA